MFQRLFLALTGLLIMGAAFSAQARVFNVNNESLAAYVEGSWSPTLQNTLSSDSNTMAHVPITINSKHPYNLSGEFGFIYARPQVNLKLGVEVIHPFDIKDEPGKNAAGAELYRMTSETSVVIPKVALEITVKKFSNTRMLLTGGLGYGYLFARNSYTMTQTGTASYGGLQDFYEDLRGYAMMYEGSVGLEGLVSDMTTYFIQAGYRQMKFDEIKHNRDVTTFQQPVSKGDTAKNMDGTNRKLDLSNYFFGIGLRFWIH